MSKKVGLQKVNTDFKRHVMSMLVCTAALFCLTACGSERQVQTVAKPDLERIPQEETAEQADRNEGALKGRDTLALTIEAMQEDGKDTALVEGKIRTKGLAFELPEGFAESKEVPGLYVTRRYPLDATNIFYVEKEADPVMQYMTKEDYEEIVANKLGVGGAASDDGAEDAAPDGENADALPADFKITEFKEMKIDGIPGFRIKSTYTYNELTITQTEYVVNADKTYILTYTMTNEYDRSDWFEASEKSIHVKK